MMQQARIRFLSAVSLSTLVLLGGCSYISEKSHQLGEHMPTYKDERCEGQNFCFGDDAKPTAGVAPQDPRYAPTMNNGGMPAGGDLPDTTYPATMPKPAYNMTDGNGQGQGAGGIDPKMPPPKGAIPGVNWPPPPPEYSSELENMPIPGSPEEGLPPSPGLPPGVDPNEPWPPVPPGMKDFPMPQDGPFGSKQGGDLD